MAVCHSNSASESLSLSTLDRLRANDQEAWHRLSEVFSPLVFYWVLKCGVQREDAQDVVQDVFRVVVMRIHDFQRDQPGSTFRGWLFAITKRKLATHWRRLHLSPQAVGGSESLRRFEQIEAQHEMDFDVDTGIEMLCHRVLELIRNEFSDTSWGIFTRVVLRLENPSAVAREMQVSVNTVYLTKSRILHRVRKEIGSLPQ